MGIKYRVLQKLPLNITVSFPRIRGQVVTISPKGLSQDRLFFSPRTFLILEDAASKLKAWAV